MSPNKNTILIGTSKGLVIFKRSTGGWKNVGVQFLGFPVSVCWVDERTNTWWVALAHRHWGQKMHRSTDEGNKNYCQALETFHLAKRGDLCSSTAQRTHF